MMSNQLMTLSEKQSGLNIKTGYTHLLTFFTHIRLKITRSVKTRGRSPKTSRITYCRDRISEFSVARYKSFAFRN